MPSGQTGAVRVTAHAIPGHGSTGSTGASVPRHRIAPARASAASGNACSSARAPHARRAAAASERRCTGWTDAATPSDPKRRASGAATSCACSTRGRNGVVPTVGARTSSAARTAASPIAWTCVAIPASAARRARTPSSAGAASHVPRPGVDRPVAPPSAPPSASYGSSSAAVRDPSVPSANALSQPIRNRSSGSGPSGAPLRSPASTAAASCGARTEAWSRRPSAPSAARAR